MSVLWRKVWRDMRAHAGQYLAVVAVIFLGITLFAASFDAFNNLTSSYERTYERLAFADLTVRGGSVERAADALAAQQGVEAVTVRTVTETSLEIGGAAIGARAVGMPADGQPAVNRIDVLRGAFPGPDDERGIVLDRHVAEHFGVDPGDGVVVRSPNGPVALVVRGVGASPEYIWPARSRQEILTTPENFGVFYASNRLVGALDPGAAAHEALVKYEAGADRGVLDARLAAAAQDAGALEVQTRAEQPSNAALEEDLKGFSELSFLFPLLFLGAAGMATFVLLGRLVRSQRPIIGVLLANGVPRSRVLVHYLSYGVALGLVGSVAGALVGALAGWAVTGLYTEAISVPDTVVSPHPATAAIGVGFGILMGLAAAAAPALAAIRANPADAMRAATPPGHGRASLAERAIPPLRRLPARWRMVLRGIERSPRRSLSMAAGVVLALILILASWGMLDTTQILLARQFDEIDRQDASLALSVRLDETLLEDVAAVEGVARAERAARIAVIAEGPDGTYATELRVLEAETRMHEFAPSGGPERLPADGVVAGSSLQTLVGATPGAPVTLRRGDGPPVDAQVRALIDEPLGTYVYASRPAAVAAFADAGGADLDAPGVAEILVRYEPGVDRDAMRARLADVPGVAAVEDARAFYESVRGALGLFYAFVGVMLGFGALMAFALIFNTTMVNLAERSGELATLRALGLSSAQVSRLLAAESMTITLVAIVPGLVIGYLAAAGLMRSYSSDLFAFDLEMRPTTLVFSALAIVAVSFASLFPALRAARRVDIGRVVRERSL